MATSTPITDSALHTRLAGAIALFRGHQVAAARSAVDALITEAAAAKPAQRDMTLMGRKGPCLLHCLRVEELEPLHRRGGSPRSAAIAPRGCAETPCIPTPINATGL